MIDKEVNIDKKLTVNFCFKKLRKENFNPL